jgi:hypothetical protein
LFLITEAEFAPERGFIQRGEEIRKFAHGRFEFN